MSPLNGTRQPHDSKPLSKDHRRKSETTLLVTALTVSLAVSLRHFSWPARIHDSATRPTGISSDYSGIYGDAGEALQNQGSVVSAVVERSVTQPQSRTPSLGSGGPKMKRVPEVL